MNQNKRESRYHKRIKWLYEEEKVKKLKFHFLINKSHDLLQTKSLCQSHTQLAILQRLQKYRE